MGRGLCKDGYLSTWARDVVAGIIHILGVLETLEACKGYAWELLGGFSLGILELGVCNLLLWAIVGHFAICF